jgi:hypothetical protein
LTLKSCGCVKYCEFDLAYDRHAFSFDGIGPAISSLLDAGIISAGTAIMNGINGALESLNVTINSIAAPTKIPPASGEDS